MSTARQAQLQEPQDDARMYYDEMYDAELGVRPHYEHVHQLLTKLKPQQLMQRQRMLEQRMLEEGITFTLYANGQPEPLERTIPFDYIPRIIAAEEWEHLERGVCQRVMALNAFLHDIYHGQNILRAGLVPRAMVVGNQYYRPEMAGIDVPGNAYMAASGIDLVRDKDGRFYVLEDNLRSPSGFSYLYKGRALMNEQLHGLLSCRPIQDIEPSLNIFLRYLRSIAPSGKPNPFIVLLTPGAYNAAYYEHAYLAQQMGIHLVEGRDLVYKDHKIYLRDLRGLRQVDVIYRRIDDAFLDPLAYNPDSLLGVPGLMNAYRAGNVAIANAPGTGVADDKAIYAYVPEMIRYYLGEEPLLDNVPTYILARQEDREYALAHLPELVVKETSLSGGYGMLIGPQATPAEIQSFAAAIRRDPSRYIAQPTLALSRAPIVHEGAIVPRHIDLRVFALTGAGEQMHVIPGGLTRVALREGSLVVNSSQGGGVKDTWVLAR